MSNGLSEDGQDFAETLFRKAHSRLLKERDGQIQEGKRGLTNRRDVISRYGHDTFINPQLSFIAGLANARAAAIEEAHRLEHKPLDSELIREIIHLAGREIESASTILLGQERDANDLEERRTGQVDPTDKVRHDELGRKLLRLRAETLREIEQDLKLKMYRETKTDPHPRQRTAAGVDRYAFHPDIDRVSSKLYNEGNFRNAVLDSFIRVIDAVKAKSGMTNRDGDDLMNHAFGCDRQRPSIQFNGLADDADRDEQRGIMLLFKALVQMRNFKAHKISTFNDPDRAYEYLALASLLMRLLDLSQSSTR